MNEVMMDMVYTDDSFCRPKESERPGKAEQDTQTEVRLTHTGSPKCDISTDLGSHHYLEEESSVRSITPSLLQNTSTHDVQMHLLHDRTQKEI